MKTTIVRKPLSIEEYKKVKNSHPLVALILNTGARISEAKRLIDEYEEGMLHLDIKTKKSIVTNRIYLNDMAIIALKSLSTYKGKSVKTLARSFTSVSDKIGVKFTAHNLRATFATNLLMNGVDLVSVSTLMNHSDVSQTAMYVKFNELYLRSGLSTLDDSVETWEGMNLFQAKKEIIRLRNLLLKGENNG